jgi:hypothetical protein
LHSKVGNIHLAQDRRGIGVERATPLLPVLVVPEFAFLLGAILFNRVADVIVFAALVAAFSQAALRSSVGSRPSATTLRKSGAFVRA